MPLTLGDIRASKIPKLLNLCPDSPKVPGEVNRIVQWLMTFGDWYGTTQRCWFRVLDQCVVAPAPVATLKGIRTCHRHVRIDPDFYRFQPGHHYDAWLGWPSMIFEYHDNVPTYKQLNQGNPRQLRIYPMDESDAGGIVTILGYDANGNWVRSSVNGIWQEGETLTITWPFAQSLYLYCSISAVLLPARNSDLNLYAVDANENLDLLARYESWETRPSYQRYQLHGFSRSEVDQGFTVEGIVKLAFQPARVDSDLLGIGNLPALEVGAEALKAKDDGDLAKANLLLFGGPKNQQLGAITILQHELRTMTNDRFAGSVRVHGTASIRPLMNGFI